MEDHRRFKRHQIPLQVEFWQDPAQPQKAQARDMSEGGLFLLLAEHEQLEEGAEVIVKSLGLGPDGTESGPELLMRVVRCSKEGMGLEIITSQDSHKEEAIAQTSTSKTIIQRLLIIDDNDMVLLWHRGDHWHLPFRELGTEESWQDGLQSFLAELVHLGAVSAASDLEPARQCMPATDSDSSCIELLVPCRYLDNQSSSNQCNRFRWESVKSIQQLGYSLDESLIKSLGIVY